MDTLTKHLEDNKNRGEIFMESRNIVQPSSDFGVQGANIKVLPLRTTVGDILIAEGLVTREQVERALERQTGKKKKKIISILRNNTCVIDT